MKLLNEELQPLADDLMSYCQNQMGYKTSPDLQFEEDEANSSNPLAKTAHYSPEENKVVVYISGRHTKDILRSLSHELVHHLQNTRGEFNGPQTTDPGYAQNNTHLRNMEKEAYLLGNMLFRDWEDNKKSKESNTMSESKLRETIRAMVKETIKKRMQNESEISEVSDEVKARTAPKDKANKSDFLPKKVRDKINNEEGEDSEEVEEGKGYGITTSPKYDQSMTGRPVQGKAAARPKEKATAVGGKLPSGKKGFGGVYVDDTKDNKPGVPKKYGKGSTVQDVNEDEVEEASGKSEPVGGTLPSGKKGFGPVYTHEPKDDDEYAPKTVKVGDKGSTMTTAKARKMNEEEVDETYGRPQYQGGMASKRRYNPDNEIDRAYYSTADREKEEIKKRNNARLRAAEKAHGLREEDEVEEGTGHATSRLKGQPVPTNKLGKTPAPMATSIARGRDSLKKEYEDKFADIEATSRLHETKQEKLNKLLMEWCKK